MGTRKQPQPERPDSAPLAAQVVLRSASGRSLTELATGPLPEDMAPFLPAASARRAVSAAFTRLGFRVLEDAQGLSMSIEAPPAIFQRVFGLAPQSAAKATAAQPISLQAPPEIAAHVAAITLLVSPEWMGN